MNIVPMRAAGSEIRLYLYLFFSYNSDDLSITTNIVKQLKSFFVLSRRGSLNNKQNLFSTIAFTSLITSSIFSLIFQGIDPI